MKRCYICKIQKSLDSFTKDSQTKDKLHPGCRSCRKIKAALRYAANPKKYNDTNKQWYKKNSAKVIERTNNYRKSNLALYRKYGLNWIKKHPDYADLRNSIARAKLGERTPKWLTKEQLREMRQIYKNKPKGYHVDHIVPLNGKDVSGLNVPWNLQYLTAKENIKKSNRMENNK